MKKKLGQESELEFNFPIFATNKSDYISWLYQTQNLTFLE